MPNKRQAIMWTNADPFHWRTYGVLGGYELSKISQTFQTVRSGVIFVEMIERYCFGNNMNPLHT